MPNYCFSNLYWASWPNTSPYFTDKKVWFPRTKSYISWDGSFAKNKFSFINFNSKKDTTYHTFVAFWGAYIFTLATNVLVNNIRKTKGATNSDKWVSCSAPTFSSCVHFSNNVTWRRTGVPDRKCVISKLLFPVFFDSFFLLWVGAYVSAVLPRLIFQKSIHLHFDFRFANEFKGWQMHKWRIAHTIQVKFDYPCVLWKGT